MQHGTFCWNELLTRDVEGAKAFYAAALGWTYEEMPMGQGGSYWVARVDGKPAAGMMHMPQDLPPGTPPHWFAYIEVTDIDRTLADVPRQGGRVMRPAWDIPEVGRIGVAIDATGAPIGLMTPLPRG
jgi:uncharacterized protein